MKRNGLNIVEYSLILASVGLIVGLALWQLGLDKDQTFVNFIKGTFGVSKTVTKQSSFVIAPLSD